MPLLHLLEVGAHRVAVARGGRFLQARQPLALLVAGAGAEPFVQVVESPLDPLGMIALGTFRVAHRLGDYFNLRPTP